MNGMIDPRTQWIIYKDKERDLLLAIQRRQSFATEQQHTLEQPWYTQAAAWLSQIARQIQPGQRRVEKLTLACCPPYAGSCPSS